MVHKTTMTREYADANAFHLDEQKLGQQGWSVDSTNGATETKSLMQRIMARFVPTKPGPLVVTYSRPRPS